MEVMRKITLLVFFLLPVCRPAAENINLALPLDNIIMDIYETVVENGQEVDFESLEQDLYALSESPVNINAATQEDLQRLPFLSDEQIDAILLYVYQHPLHSLYELQLIPCLKSYDIRDMLPFVCVAPVEPEPVVYWKENFRQAKHQLTLRADMRNMERTAYDPYYVSLKYLFDSKHFQAGCSMERDPGEPWWGKKTYVFDFYGGFVQLNRLGSHLDKWIMGDYRASFGQGLVLSSPTYSGGKQVSSAGRRREGISRHHSTQEYNFFRGTAATLQWGNVELTALYSARRIDARRGSDGTFPSVITTGYHRTATELHTKQSVWQHTIATHVSYRHNRMKVGMTLRETLFDATLVPTPTYYNANYFQGKRQFAAGFDYRWSYRRFSLFGELAAAQNRRWGIANITGIRLAPVSDLTLVALYRFYSPTYDVFNANAFGETSRNNDETGVYIGAEVSLVPKWRFSAYADMFSFRFPKYGIKTPSSGYEVMFQADFTLSEELQMQWRFRAKQKAERDRYSLRYYVCWQTGGWRFRTHLEGNLSKENDQRKPVPGAMLAEDCSYQLQRVPILLQLRLQAFYAPNYQNRFFAYENDVLYAFSIPSVYGTGTRYYLNVRYKINEHWAVYCRASQTVYSKQWVSQQQLTHQRVTDVHVLVRWTY